MWEVETTEDFDEWFESLDAAEQDEIDAKAIKVAKSFDELANRLMTPERRARAAKRAKQLLAEMLLSELRKLAGKSQSELARILGVKQPSLSKLEQQDDMQISTLKRIVEALGGEVRIIARFPKNDVEISQFTRKPRKNSKKKTRELQELQLV